MALEPAVLWTHVAAGVLALFAGAGALVTEKGGRRHRRLGRAYVAGMTVVSATALALLALDRSLTRLFLGLVAVLSFYLAFSGYRVLSRKRPADVPVRADWVAVGLLGAAGAGLLGMGAWLLAAGSGFAPVLLVFGGIAAAFAAGDVRAFRGDGGDPWLLEHLTRMVAAYIATVTAFVTVNATFAPVLVAWLLPTAVGTVGIAVLRRRYG